MLKREIMSSNSPCAACKHLRRKCTQECVFAPYFPPDNPQKFINVHKVFGNSNVTKLLNELNVEERGDAVNSLTYEAESRLQDPVYGCVKLVSILQHRLKTVQHELLNAKKELATYIGPSAMLPANYPYNGQPMAAGPTGIPHHQHQFVEAQQLAGREQEMLRSCAQEQQHQVQRQLLHQLQQQQQHNLHQQLQEDLLRFSNGFGEDGGSVTATGFNQIGMQQLAVGSSYHNNQRQEASSLSIQMQERLHQEQQPQLYTNRQQQPPRANCNRISHLC